MTPERANAPFGNTRSITRTHKHESMSPRRCNVQPIGLQPRLGRCVRWRSVSADCVRPRAGSSSAGVGDESRRDFTNEAAEPSRQFIAHRQSQCPGRSIFQRSFPRNSQAFGVRDLRSDPAGRQQCSTVRLRSVYGDATAKQSPEHERWRKLKRRRGHGRLEHVEHVDHCTLTGVGKRRE